MDGAGGGQAPRRAPGSQDRVIELRRGEDHAAGGIASDDEKRSVGQQRRGVGEAARAHAASRAPRSRGRGGELRRGQVGAPSVRSARYEQLSGWYERLGI